MRRLERKLEFCELTEEGNFFHNPLPISWNYMALDDT